MHLQPALVTCEPGCYGAEVAARGLRGLTGMAHALSTVSDSNTGQDRPILTGLAPVRASAFAGASRIRITASS